MKKALPLLKNGRAIMSHKAYFSEHPKNSENSVPKSLLLTFGMFRKLYSHFGTERSLHGE